MNKLSRSIAVAILSLSLSSVAVAGDMHCGAPAMVHTNGVELITNAETLDDPSPSGGSEETETASAWGSVVEVIQLALSIL